MDEVTPVEELSFEAARDELELVVRRLEDGSTSLEQALALWERGEALYRACRTRLEAAEARIEKLAEALAEPPAAAGQDPQDSGIGPT
ncbi:MAG TPA: exodeoxyribonuclease VII small subunit [Gaiellales bacterium]|jgi:exodeoxyribonuclease VII small subunit|nr:exodeoxyribonuclease VII small subunit [Gaiellales bacterium]